MLTKREQALLHAVAAEMREHYEPRIAALEARTLERGEKGDPGCDAKPVDEAAVVDKVLARIQKPADGKDAPPVDVDALFFRIKAELPALIPAPIKGDQGDKGEKGEPGRDAAALEFVTLDADKSYPRGTFALYKAGIFFAERMTDAIKGSDYKSAGWRLLVSGFESFKAKLLSDGRTFEFAVTRTDGSVEKERVKVALPKRCGVWRETVTYEPGDQVQLSGSSWEAKEVTAEKPGTSKAWELVARRGRDGKGAT